MMRLAVYLAHAGVASRRASESLIRDGFVTVNEVKVTEVVTLINPDHDSVRVRGRIVSPEEHVYYLVHKPAGYISSSRARRGEKLVTSLVPKHPRVYPVGRLDKDSSGLIILTNDGELTLKLTHPRYGVAKVYEITLDMPYTDALGVRLKRGIRFPEGLARADMVEKIGSRKIRVTLHQGFNRQIRRMLGFCGYTVVKLIRTAEGSVALGDLPEGKCRRLTRSELHV